MKLRTKVSTGDPQWTLFPSVFSFGQRSSRFVLSDEEVPIEMESALYDWSNLAPADSSSSCTRRSRSSRFLFQVKAASGRDTIVILIDTQGVHDPKTPIKNDMSIFALSVLLSSIQIFNMQNRIQGDDLSTLHFFTEFGRLVRFESSEANIRPDLKPFQELIFLVRDWPHPGDVPYGWNGGQEVLDE